MQVEQRRRRFAFCYMQVEQRDRRNERSNSSRENAVDDLSVATGKLSNAVDEMKPPNSLRENAVDDFCVAKCKLNDAAGRFEYCLMQVEQRGLRWERLISSRENATDDLNVAKYKLHDAAHEMIDHFPCGTALLA